jgi:hypothetical protein
MIGCRARLPFMLEPKARQVVTSLRSDTSGVQELGALVLELAQEVDRLRAEMDKVNPEQVARFMAEYMDK